MRTRNQILQNISILMCAFWVVFCTDFTDIDAKGFHDTLQHQAAVEETPDVEEHIETASLSASTGDSEGFAGFPSDGASGTDPSTDPLLSRRPPPRAGLVHFPSAVRSQIATTVLRP